MSGAGSQTLFKAFLHVSNLNNTGIDVSKPVMLFEDAQGNLGVCAKTDNTKQLGEMLQKWINRSGTTRFPFCHIAQPLDHWFLRPVDLIDGTCGACSPTRDDATHGQIPKG